MGIRNLFNSVKRVLNTPVTFRRPPAPVPPAVQRYNMAAVPGRSHRQSRTWSRKLNRRAIQKAERAEVLQRNRIRLLTDPAYLRKVARDNAAAFGKYDSAYGAGL